MTFLSLVVYCTTVGAPFLMHVGIICYIETLIFELAYNLRKLIVKMLKEYEIDELG